MLTKLLKLQLPNNLQSMCQNYKLFVSGDIQCVIAFDLKNQALKMCYSYSQIDVNYVEISSFISFEDMKDFDTYVSSLGLYKCQKTSKLNCDVQTIKSVYHDFLSLKSIPKIVRNEVEVYKLLNTNGFTVGPQLQATVNKKQYSGYKLASTLSPSFIFMYSCFLNARRSFWNFSRGLFKTKIV